MRHEERGAAGGHQRTSARAVRWRDPCGPCLPHDEKKGKINHSHMGMFSSFCVCSRLCVTIPTRAARVRQKAARLTRRAPPHSPPQNPLSQSHNLSSKKATTKWYAPRPPAGIGSYVAVGNNVYLACFSFCWSPRFAHACCLADRPHVGGVLCARAQPNVFSPLYVMYRKPSLSFCSS